MTAKYFAILTNYGAAQLANAVALGTQMNISKMAVGDGGGTLPVPDPAQTKLVRETRRAAVNQVSIDEKNPNFIIAEQVIPENEGGWFIREIGLFDDNGGLIAVGNAPETYKPNLQEGSGRTQVIQMVLMVSSTQAITLKIDPSVVLATREYVTKSIDAAIQASEARAAQTYQPKGDYVTNPYLKLELLKKIDKADITQQLGNDTGKVVSQNLLTTELGKKAGITDVIKNTLIGIPGGSDVLTYFPGKPTGFYSSGESLNNTPEPAAWRDFIWLNHGSDRYGQLICLWEGGKSAVRTLNVGVWDSQWSITLSDVDIVGELGKSQKKVISQKTVTEELQAESLLTKIKTVDGANSGLDADLLRGLPADFDSYGDPDGYQKLPSRKMWQWGGVIIPPEAIVTVTFRTAFPKQVFAVVGNPHSSSYSQSTATINQSSYTKGSFGVRNNSTTTQIFFQYMAIGE